MPTGRSEYAHIKLSNIPQEFIGAYDLTKHTCNDWVYLEILKGCYGLSQAGKLENYLLLVCLNKDGYYESATTPGLWCHKWRIIIFGLIVDDFGIEYIGKLHVQHLLHILQ